MCGHRRNEPRCGPAGRGGNAVRLAGLRGRMAGALRGGGPSDAHQGEAEGRGSCRVCGALPRTTPHANATWEAPWCKSDRFSEKNRAGFANVIFVLPTTAV